jgi:hypothetical protein
MITSQMSRLVMDAETISNGLMTHSHQRLSSLSGRKLATGPIVYPAVLAETIKAPGEPGILRSPPDASKFTCQ